ncbi:hypothetical protein [Streptomyces bungoensis]|uniref:hypothetical protein n=1 Tax=Streptomyces bungoensis TaxID=285568 RepID=UPI000AE9B3C5|nr:hypothetical protein [Streptomyces bungoensis]
MAPGEVITAEVLNGLRSGIGHGFPVSDSADPTLRTLRVLAAPPNGGVRTARCSRGA